MRGLNHLVSAAFVISLCGPAGAAFEGATFNAIVRTEARHFGPPYPIPPIDVDGGQFPGVGEYFSAAYDSSLQASACHAELEFTSDDHRIAGTWRATGEAGCGFPGSCEAIATAALSVRFTLNEANELLFSLGSTGSYSGAGSVQIVLVDLDDGMNGMPPPSMVIHMTPNGDFGNVRFTIAPGPYELFIGAMVSAQGGPNSLGNATLDLALVVAPLPGPVTCLGDADGDSMVVFNDIVAVLANYGAVYFPLSGPGDSNGDGRVNFDDIIGTLARYGSDCR